MDRKKTVLLVMGSTRAGRNCPTITSWVASVGRAGSDYEYEMIDLAKWPLPMDDEPGIPALGGYSQPHTIACGRGHFRYASVQLGISGGP